MKTKGLLLLLVAAIAAYFTLPWVFIYIGNLLGPNPPRPEIKYGEFPFRLEYEINGQQKAIEDILICEFNGFGVDEGRGKYRKWTEKLASGEEMLILLKVNDSMVISFHPGSAAYYMGDLEMSKNGGSSFPNALYDERDGGITTSGIIEADELLSQYNIKLISWDYTPPISNDFAQTK